MRVVQQAVRIAFVAQMGKQPEQLQNSADALAARLDAAPPASGAPRPSWEATELATQAAQLMVNEVLDWRVVFLDEPLKTA